MARTVTRLPLATPARVSAPGGSDFSRATVACGRLQIRPADPQAAGVGGGFANVVVLLKAMKLFLIAAGKAQSAIAMTRSVSQRCPRICLTLHFPDAVGAAASSLTAGQKLAIVAGLSCQHVEQRAVGDFADVRAVELSVFGWFRSGQHGDTLAQEDESWQTSLNLCGLTFLSCKQSASVFMMDECTLAKY